MMLGTGAAVLQDLVGVKPALILVLHELLSCGATGKAQVPLAPIACRPLEELGGRVSI